MGGLLLRLLQGDFRGHDCLTECHVQSRLERQKTIYIITTINLLVKAGVRAGFMAEEDGSTEVKPFSRASVCV